MSYLTYAQLSEDINFQRRGRACTLQQANYWVNDERPNMVALSQALIKGSAGPTQTMYLGICSGPGFADTVDTGDGNIDSSLITDEDMLAQCQAIYPAVASLYFNDDGTPVEALAT
jgi:hypothetical protein